MSENIYLLVTFLTTIAVVILGFVFSMITLIITNIFHERRDKQNQQRNLEDRKRAEIIRNKKHRIEQGEECADLLLIKATDLSMVAKLIIINPYTENDMFEASKKVDELMVSTEQSYRRSSIIYALGDDRLTAIAQNFNDLILEERLHGQKLMNKWRDQLINEKEEMERRSVFLVKANKTHGEMLKILDDLLNNAIENM